MNRISSLTSLGLLALLVCGAFAFAGAGKVSKFDCCYPGSPCCFPGSPCCDGLDCCYPGSPCCFEGSPCCTGACELKAKAKATVSTCCERSEACCEEAAGCCANPAVKTGGTRNVKKSGCCAGH